MTGLFIAFEGGDGAGKSTQSRLLESALTGAGYNAVLLHEPGSTELGDYLRAYLVDDRPIAPLAELLLFEASRAELLARRIRPELDAGSVIICDRFAGSTVAYQGYGRSIDLGGIQWLNDFASGRVYPDLTILLDIHPARGLDRRNERLLQLVLPFNGASDRFEDETLAFHDRVRQGFLEQAAANPDRWLIIDGDRSIDDVAECVWAAVSSLLVSQDVVRAERR